MKKNLTLVALLIGSSAVYGQRVMTMSQAALPELTVNDGKALTDLPIEKADGDLLWSSDFSVAADWTVTTLGQGTWIVGNDASPEMGLPLPSPGFSAMGLLPYLTTTPTPTQANGHAFFNASRYTIPPQVPSSQNSYLTSSSFPLLGSTVITVSFAQRYRKFGDVLTVEFSGDNGITWAAMETVNAIATNANGTATVTADLNSGGASANGKIRFHWLSDTQGGYGWLIDDVTVRVGNANNLSMQNNQAFIGGQAIQYSKFPLTQVANAGNVYFSSEVKNIGYAAQPTTLRVTSGAYTGNSAVTSISSFLTDSIKLGTNLDASPGFPIPTAIGVSTFTFTALSSNPLVQTSDDSKTKTLEITQNILAVDAYVTSASITGSFTDWSTPGTGAPAIGNIIEIFAAQDVQVVQVGLFNVAGPAQAPLIGKNVKGQIWLFTPGVNTWSLFAETEPRVVAAIDFGKIVKTSFASPISLLPGTYAVLGGGDPTPAGGAAGQNIPIALSGTTVAGNTVGIRSNAIIGLASSPSTPEIIFTPVVRLDFTDYASIEENAIAITGMYPNPTSGRTELSLNLINNGDVSISVVDLTGKVVYTNVYTDLNSGGQTIELDATSFASGMYQVNVVSNGASVTQKLIKK